MIHSITANRASFKPVRLRDDFNVVLADRSPDATDRESRNGSGKTSVVRILHWCLGASADAKHPFRVAEELSAWRFTVTLKIGDRLLGVSRAVEQPNRIELEGEDVVKLVPEARESDDATWLPLDEWKRAIGSLLFGLEPDEIVGPETPNPRALLDYLARLDRDSFIDPFRHFSAQGAADQQIQHSFFLGLDWSYPAKSKALGDEAKKLSDAEDAVAKAVAFQRGAENRAELEGELEARIVNLRREVAKREEELRDFRVLPQYRELEAQASTLTLRIHELATENVVDEQTVDFYRQSLVEEQPADLSKLREVYAEAGVVFGEALNKRMEEVQSFHAQLVENRRGYLASELNRLGRQIEGREAEKAKLDAERRAVMKVLEEHGALEEHQRLQQLLGLRQRELDRLESELGNLRRFETRLAEIRLERQQLVIDARTDMAARRDVITEAVELFGANTAELYEEPGVLNIAVNRDGGYQLRCDIAKGDSQAVQEMVVFAYDLTVAELLTKRGRGPGFLVHDSAIFDGVDERQRAKALVLAQRKARECGFQYLCLLNSDSIPADELPEGFSIEDYVVLRLSDRGEDGGLFGIRF